MENFFIRMLEEQKTLDAKIEKLAVFLKGDTSNLHNEQVQMMDNQLHHMRAYSVALGQRVEFERRIRLK